MATNDDFVMRMVQLAEMAARLPHGPTMTVEWTEAPPDLVLALALQDDGVRSWSDANGKRIDKAEWARGVVLFRARHTCAAPPKAARPKLTLVKP